MASTPAQSESALPALTPMMAQFFEIKAANPGYLLFYRMGDFYELFFEDAEIAAEALGIVLTKRGKHLGQDIAMCGVPIHAAQDYLKRLIGLGHRVAVCEQMEDPAEARKRGSKSVVRRDVVRLVTAGTLTEDDLLPQRGANYLATVSLVRHGELEFGLAWADISTGDTHVACLSAEAVGNELARIDPAELVLSEATRLALVEAHALGSGLNERLSLVDAALFESDEATRQLRQSYPGPDTDASAFPRVVRSALGALCGYVADSQKGVAPALRWPETEATDGLLLIDQATRGSLELLETQRGSEIGSLRHTIDRTVTAAGARLFSQRLAAPLARADLINARLDMVARSAKDLLLTDRLRADLKATPDLARALTRLALERGGPRDLRSVGKAVASAIVLAERLHQAGDLPQGLASVAEKLAAAPRQLAEDLLAALVEEPPMMTRDGGFIAKGHDEALDAERALGSETRAVIASLQARLASETDTKALKIKHNGVLGFFVEVPSAQGQKLLEEPHRDSFVHRQTMANAMRFTTRELADLESRIANAQHNALEIELRIFAELRKAVLGGLDQLRGLADALAELDVTTALGRLAANESHVRPKVDDSLSFEISAGRHPVVEAMVRKDGHAFVANDVDLSGSESEGGGRLWLVTGPNMGGKSTFLRQNALIAIMAQMGAFVPADSAHIGVIDRVFSRVGASDDIAHGRSTFMVEMVETAAILNRATRRSLVILDEIGRGTATFDGLSIAWATVESLHETTGCRALFATHFHELTALHKSLSRIVNVTMKVREWEGEVVFLHEVGRGAADRSYGVQVARLAGLPEPVLTRARQVLDFLEQRAAGATLSEGTGTVLDDLPLFAHQPPPAPVKTDPVYTLLDSIRPDDVTPKMAIDLLYELKKTRDAARRS
ncbi:DNA mismatch repair protein MutS [Devosia pacifica]|uniref:DNA mismatch repair protein MutS n=1 Tax=Devosia pacifica TaxID=1335967 RepID=A0A918S5I0_9HYPH|nr:DNA mismatch repair protein MutS [Devosia pacifica]GHA22527.1 DNA mismatch repair protein MutS [Devosia pacifica]